MATALDIDTVFRDNKVKGDIHSGAHEPDKAEIRAGLKAWLGGAANPSIVKQTKAALDAVTPASENSGGLVLNDPDAAKNGYYYRSAASWVLGRGFPDTFARVTLSGSGTTQTGVVNAGVNPASIEVFFAKVVTQNTGAMTLSISGGSANPVVNLAGNPLSAGEWTGMVMFYLNEANQYQLLIDAGAAASAAQSATSAGLDADRAEAASELAHDYANAAGAAAGLGFFKDQATLEADTGLSYSGTGAVTAGFVVTTRSEGKVFIVAAAAAVDHHITTAGGVKLYDRGVYSSPAIAQAQQVMDRIKRGLAVDILVVSDSTGNGPTRWVYKFGEELGRMTGADVFVRQWDVGTGNYGPYDQVWDGSGPVVTIWNYAISGSTAIRGLGADLLPAMVIGTMAGRDFDLCVINYGHNGGDSVNVQLGLEAAAIGVISRLYPFTPMIVIGQNKSTVTTAMREKARVFNHMTTLMNLGFINIHAFFEDYAVPIEDYYLDTVHPNENASRLWGFCVARAFVYQPDAARSVGHSILGRGIIKQAQRYSELTSGLLSSGTSVLRQTTSGAWQSDGGSLQITGDGVTAGAYVRWVVIPSADIVMYRGRWITATVFLRIPNGVPPAECCVVQLNDGVGSARAPQPLETGAAFVPISVSLKVAAASTEVSLLVYSAFGAANTASFWVDRWNVVDGPIAADPNANANAPEIIVGSNGIAILHPNGDMICRKTVAANAIPITTAWGTAFQSAAIALGNWQRDFLTIDHQTVRAYANDGSLTAPPAEFGSLLTTGPRSIHLWSPASTAAKDYTITVEGKGRWR